MRKVILILLVFISAKVNAQVYQEMPQYGYRANRMVFDSTLQIPTVCGVPTLKSIVKTNKSGAIAYDSCNARFYAYNPKTLTWTAITSGSADTTSLSNRINLKIDSLKRSNDSVYAYRNGTRVFQFKDSVGGGGTIPTLQQVTTQGSTTTIGISVPSINIGNAGSALSVGTTNESLTITTPTGDELLYVKNNVGAGIRFGGAGQSLELLTFASGNVSLQAPSNSGTIALTSDTTNKFVNRLTRTIGKDSIIYFVGGNRFAIKDSVGTNPAPVGYYGSFYDTTTQSASVINTAYGVKLGVTDLTNGITIANNSKIKFANAGIYNLQFSLQLEKTGGSGNMITDIWLKKNNINLDGTNGKIVLTGSANASPIIAAWNYVVAINSNDSLELMWAVDNINVKIISASASSPHPSTASAILTVTQQSGIMAGTGISPLDTANMLIPYLRKIDTLSLSNRINLKLNISDTSTMLSKYLRKTDTATLSNRIDLKLNIADTATMLSKYLRKTDTATLSSRIDLRVKYTDSASMLTNYARTNLVNTKLNISDTSTLQPKSISAYTILANKTSATANVTAQAFRDTSGVYDGTITWTGTTAPSGATNHTYRLTQVGKCVTINISLLYATNGSVISKLTATLPSNAPTPVQPTGLTSALQNIYVANAQYITSTNTTANAILRTTLRNNTANNGFEFLIEGVSNTVAQVNIICQYWTN
jgi:hypothetical protein